ncbi:MAG: hypothetical protein VR64_23865 [Desulfatitalea sp. BRH_c12]|nr:MAG: hypothetical protein VR64_23865 [Desulfatitalea sp. BRH_c12]
MYKALSVAGEGGITFGRRPEKIPVNIFPRRLASNNTSPYKFAFARTALKYGLNSIGLEQGDDLLVPEFICESALEPLQELGIKPKYYPVGPTLEPEWTWVEQRISMATKALLIVHYFGQPQQMKTCVKFCQDHSLLLIEDNAHGFGGTFSGQLLGTFGDMGVSAPRKSFPIINGAYLYIYHGTNPDLSTLILQPRASLSIKHRLKNRIKQLPVIDYVMKHRQRVTEHRKRLGAPVPYGSQNAFRDPPILKDFGMDESTDSFLHQENIDRVRENRQTIYYLWQQWTSRQGLMPVFPNLSPGAIPLVFPTFAESATISRQWYERGHRAGVDIHSWPTLPHAIVEGNNGAMRLWERLVCFPIHQEMDVQLLERRLAIL